MELLLTNDDGIEAPGLTALLQAMDGIGRLHVVAPHEVQSGSSHTMMDRSPLRVTARQLPGAATAHAVEGRPADCTRLGLRHYARDAAWVISGINAGGNLGVDVYYSGTVAAAREAAIMGRPAIAISQFIRARDGLDWDRAARWAAHMIRVLMNLPQQPGQFWNVNLPQPTTDAPPAVAVVPLAIDAHNVDYRRENEAGEATVFHYRGRYQDRPAPAGSDVEAVFSGRISVTPLLLDATDRGALDDGLQMPAPPA